MDGNISFSEAALSEIDNMMKLISELLYKSIDLMDTQDESQLPAIKALEEEVDTTEEDYQQDHVDRLTRGECTPAAGMIFGDILSNLERVADHACNIAFLIAEKKTHRQKTLAGDTAD
jgi:phosphate:Na+ symporter